MSKAIHVHVRKSWKLHGGLSWKLEAGSWKLEVGSWKLEAESWKLDLEGGSWNWKVEAGSLKFDGHSNQHGSTYVHPSKSILPLLCIIQCMMKVGCFSLEIVSQKHCSFCKSEVGSQS